MNVCHQPIVVKWLYDSYNESRGQERPNSHGLDTESLLRNWKVIYSDFALCRVSFGEDSTNIEFIFDDNKELQYYAL